MRCRRFCILAGKSTAAALNGEIIGWEDRPGIWQQIWRLPCRRGRQTRQSSRCRWVAQPARQHPGLRREHPPGRVERDFLRQVSQYSHSSCNRAGQQLTISVRQPCIAVTPYLKAWFSPSNDSCTICMVRATWSRRPACKPTSSKVDSLYTHFLCDRCAQVSAHNLCERVCKCAEYAPICLRTKR